MVPSGAIETFPCECRCGCGRIGSVIPENGPSLCGPCLHLWDLQPIGFGSVAHGPKPRKAGTGREPPIPDRPTRNT